jgi:hypothetical protein
MCQQPKPIFLGNACGQKVDAKVLDRFHHVCKWTLAG